MIFELKRFMPRKGFEKKKYGKKNTDSFPEYENKIKEFKFNEVQDNLIKNNLNHKFKGERPQTNN